MNQEKDNMIEAVNLTKMYKDFKAVDDISFFVKRGEILAFLGPNGAGKSTTIKMFTTLLHPTSGQITINGVDPVKDPDKARLSFGIVFQDPSLDEELTTYENMDLHAILYSVKDKKIKIEQLLKFVELWDRKDELVKTFSGGMRRRLEIARGLIHHPKILFLDEPTLGLDPQTRNSIWEYVKKMNKEEGMTVLLTTHYMEEAERVADRIVVIDHGKIISQGTAAELMKQTSKDSLEDAFLVLTGKTVRDEESSGIEDARLHRRMWHK